MIQAFVLIAFSLAIVTAKRPSWKELEGYSFEQYVKDFRLPVQTDSADYVIRKELFLAELKRVKAHNAKNLSWKEGINKFSAMTVREKKAFLGRSKGAAKAHKLQGSKHAQAAEVSNLNKDISALPLNVDWRNDDVMSAVKDQGYCGSCWAFASTAAIESHVAIASGLLFDLSVQQMTACAPNPDSCGGTGGCAGATSELAFDYVAGSDGMFEEYQYSYTAYYGTTGDCSLPKLTSPVAAIEGYVQLPSNNYTALMNAVATVGPVVISVDASTWSAYESGIYNGCNQENPDIDHAVVLAGYGVDSGDKYWLVRNSWSAAWGEEGYIRIARLDSEDEVCGLDTTPQDGVACAGDDTPEKVCGTCGIIFDSAYPTGASAL